MHNILHFMNLLLCWYFAAHHTKLCLKAETHDATNCGDTSPHLHCCCNKSLALSLSMRCVSRIQTSLNLCDRSQRQNSVAATMIFTCHTICCSNLSHRFVASCVSALKVFSSRQHSMRNTQKMLNTLKTPKLLA